MHRLCTALAMTVCLWVALACGMDADDRMVRRYAGCMADANTALHRLTVSSAVGTVRLSAEAVEERVRGRMESGELSMAKIRAGLRSLLQVGVDGSYGNGASKRRLGWA